MQLLPDQLHPTAWQLLIHQVRLGCQNFLSSRYYPDVGPTVHVVGLHMEFDVAAPGRSHGVMPESALKDREEQDQGRADADALIGSQVCMILASVHVRCMRLRVLLDAGLIKRWPYLRCASVATCTYYCMYLSCSKSVAQCQRLRLDLSGPFLHDQQPYLAETSQSP